MVPQVMQTGEAGAQNGAVAVGVGKVETDAEVDWSGVTDRATVG